MSVDTLIDNIMQSLDNSKLAELREKFGDDEETVNDLMTLYRNQQKEKYDKALADRKVAEEYREQTENARLADEFIAMKKTFPELTDFASLPAEVKKAAIGGNSLEHAYLKYQHSEKQKITAAKEAAKAAAEISAGPMSGESDSKTENESRFLRALWGN